MKKLPLFFSLLVMTMLSFKQVSANPPGAGAITAFWLTASNVNSMASAGAVSLKIYGSTDESGNSGYIMAGVDGAGNPLPNQIFMVGNKGICPPQCDFTGMDASASAVESSTAEVNVNRYMSANAGVNNCATFTMNSLGKMRTGSTYIKVSIGSSASAAGYSDSGAPTKTSATGTASNSGM